MNAANLRRCSAAVLDVLSNGFGEDILPTLMPSIQETLGRTDDESWKEREAVVLSLGVVAGVCLNGLYPCLQKMFADVLFPYLDDEFPLLRDTTRWTLSQYCESMVEEVGWVHAELAKVEESKKQEVDKLRAELIKADKLKEAAVVSRHILCDWLQSEVSSLKASLAERDDEAVALKRALEERTDESEGWKSRFEAVKRACDEVAAEAAKRRRLDQSYS